MNWGSNFDALKSKMNQGVIAMNNSVKDVASSVQVAASSVQQAVRKGETMGSILNLDRLNPRQGGEKYIPSMKLGYATDRIGVVAFPSNIEKLSGYLNDKHGSDYMIWNLSEAEYDTKSFQGQIVDFKFPGHPAPPLVLLFKLCISMESWLESSPDHVAIIQCVSGRGRSITVASCLLEWIGKTPYALDALRHLCDIVGGNFTECIVPSQVRYLDIFHTVMQGSKPSYNPIKLSCVTMSNFPDMMSLEDKKGCTPYLQLYKEGKLLFTSIWEDNKSQAGTKSYSCDQVVTFENIDCSLEGDILVRMRNIKAGKGESMFRFGFNTCYTAVGPWVLGKTDLDGASVDPRFSSPAFEVELTFVQDQEELSNKISESEMFDGLLESKEIFWDVIARKKQERSLPKPPLVKELPHTTEFSILDEDDDEYYKNGRGSNDDIDDLDSELMALDDDPVTTDTVAQNESNTVIEEDPELAELESFLNDL